MRILALNCGSSSIKSAVFDAAQLRRLQSIRIEDIGAASCSMLVGDARRALPADLNLESALQLLMDQWRGQSTANGLAGVVHRVVHGGDAFPHPVRVEGDVMHRLAAASDLAPLHNPPALHAIRSACSAFPDVPHIAVFDTTFHATLPPHAREYALPEKIRASLGVRRYGFHGLSHAHVMTSVADSMSRLPQALRIVSCHLGNGASVTAIEHGRSVETSMGMTPLEGLVMGTRGGDIDPGVLLHLLDAGGMSVRELDDMLNHASGLKGVAGTNDVREIERRAQGGDEKCRLALLIYSHRVRKYIGAYTAVMGGVDAIAFTGGVGENSARIRRDCLLRLEHLGALLDDARNLGMQPGAEAACVEISAAEARTRIFVVKADEERSMVRDALALLGR
jgi:acetate kinase